MGKRTINKRNKDRDQNELKPSEKYQLVNASWEALIREEDFYIAAKILDSNKLVKHEATYDFILSGLLTCDECGQPLFGQSATGKVRKHYYYGHSKKTSCKIKRYPAVELEARIKKHLFSILNNQALRNDFIEVLRELSEMKPNESREVLQAKKKEQQCLSAQVEKLLDIISKNEIAGSTDSLLKRVRDAEKRLEVVKDEILELELKAKYDMVDTIDCEYVLGNLKKLSSERFRKFKLQKKRLLVKSIIERIHISPDNLIQINVWTQESKNKGKKNCSFQKKGVILPFCKLGRPLGITNVSSGGMSFKDSTNSDIVTSLVEGSSRIAVGGVDGTRTRDLRRDRPAS